MTSVSRAAELSLPVRVAAANDYELIVAGLFNLLDGFPDHIEVCDRILVGEPIEHGPIDVVLYDTYGRTGTAAAAISELVGLEAVRNVALFSLDLSPVAVDDAFAAGASGVISKSLAAGSICDALVAVSAGQQVVALGAEGDEGDAVAAELDWPGKAEGLTERESQVLVLVAEGLTNKEIATTLYVSVETVKTHLRQILAKLEVRNRVEATAFVVRTGAFARYQPATPDDALRAPPAL